MSAVTVAPGEAIKAQGKLMSFVGSFRCPATVLTGDVSSRFMQRMI